MRRLPTTQNVRLLAGATLAVIAHATAHAQEAPAGGAGTADTPPGLGDIVVTAQKRAENIQNTPIAITAVTSERIAQGGLDRPSKLQFSVPSMSYSNASGFVYLSLRGVGTNVANLSESSVATYQDGVYTGMMLAQAVPTFDLERIEVLRGPQGTLYGRNTTGGVINYISKAPDFEYGASGDASYGNYNSVEVNAGATGPLVEDKIAVRASFHYGKHDGYYRNIATREDAYANDNIGGRIAVLLRPTENLKLTIRGDAARDKSTDGYALLAMTGVDGLSDAAHPLGIFSQPASFFEAVPGLLSPADIAKLNGGSIAQFYDLTQAEIAAPDSQRTKTIANWSPTLYKTKSSGVSFTADWDIGSVNVKSITAYRFGRLYNNDEIAGVSYPTLYTGPILQRERQYTQEFNISGKSLGNRMDWLVGAFYYHNDGFNTTTSYLPSFGQLLQASYFLANPPGSPYTFNLNPTSLPSLNTLPGVFPSTLQTVPFSGPGFPGDGAGSFLAAGSTIPVTPFAGGVMNQKSDSYAAFAQATYHLTDSLRLTGGFRYTIDRKRADRTYHSNFGWALAANGIYNAVQAGYLPPEAYTEPGIAAAAGLCEHSKTSRTWKAPTGMISLDYDAAPGVLSYAKVSWGYKAGGMNNAECTNIYNPEYLTAYEAGVKAVFADGQILTNLATYYYDYKDIQFASTNNNAVSILNAASAKSFGIELEYAFRPRFAPGWQLDGSASFQDSKYGEGCFGDPANTNNAAFLSTPIQACPATVINPTTGQAVPIGPTANIKGNAMIRAPRWKANIGLQYSTDAGDFGNLMARVDASWTDKEYNDLWNGKVVGMERSTQGARWMLNALLAWTSPDKNYAVEVFGDNLTDSIYYNNIVAINVPINVYNVSGQLAAPRTYGIRIRAKFGSSIN